MAVGVGGGALAEQDEAGTRPHRRPPASAGRAVLSLVSAS
jgi:hypothetical protein